MEKFCYMRYSSQEEKNKYNLPEDSPMLQYIEKENYMYVSAPKCASSTIRDTIPNDGWSRTKLQKAIDISKNKYTFSFTRNPYNRILSCWNGWVKSKKGSRLFLIPGITYGQSFSDFVNVIKDIPDELSDQHFVTLTTCLFIDKIDYNFFGKVESFNNDWNKMGEEIDIPNNIRKTAVTGVGNKIDEFYTKDLIDIINKRYQKDFENFNYDFR